MTEHQHTAPGCTRAAAPRDVPEIATVHLEGFEGFFLSFLGRDFLQLLYRRLLTDPEGIVLVCETDGRVAGFVAGVTCQTGFFRRALAGDAFRFAWAALGALLRRPTIAPRLLRALWRPSEAAKDSAAASLMSIAVCPEDQGKGIGQELVRAFGEQLAARGVRSYCLTTDRDNNDRTHRFYQKLGFRLVREFVRPDGRAMAEYNMTLEG